MRDNHTFVPLPLDVEAAEAVLRNEFNQGYTYGMCCSHDTPVRYVHARGSDQAEEFFKQARHWIEEALSVHQNRNNGRPR